MSTVPNVKEKGAPPRHAVCARRTAMLAITAKHSALDVPLVIGVMCSKRAHETAFITEMTPQHCCLWFHRGLFVCINTQDADSCLTRKYIAASVGYPQVARFLDSSLITHLFTTTALTGDWRSGVTHNTLTAALW